MIRDELQSFTSKSIELLTKYAAEAFNNNYNLDLEINQILGNIKEINSEDNKKEIVKNKKIDEEEEEEEEITILMENLCFAKKKDGSICNKKIKGNGMFCGNHSHIKASIPLSEYINIVFKEKKYEIKPKVLSIGNGWIDEANMDKWPQIIITTTNVLKGNIIFFTEYEDYLGAGIFVIQYNSSDKRKSYNFATHYVEINNYCDSLGGSLYIKINFTPLEKLENKPIYNRITDLLNSYGISYNLSQITKGKKDLSESNPIVATSKINDILYKHNNVMYFIKDKYVIACNEIENENNDINDDSD